MTREQEIKRLRAQLADAERGLFDDDEWHEVPQARFLSWPPAQQFAYCAARDEASAANADTPEHAAWYLARAASYREMI